MVLLGKDEESETQLPPRRRRRVRETDNNHPFDSLANAIGDNLFENLRSQMNQAGSNPVAIPVLPDVEEVSEVGSDSESIIGETVDNAVAGNRLGLEVRESVGATQLAQLEIADGESAVNVEENANIDNAALEEVTEQEEDRQEEEELNDHVEDEDEEEEELDSDDSADDVSSEEILTDLEELDSDIEDIERCLEELNGMLNIVRRH